MTITLIPRKREENNDYHLNSYNTPARVQIGEQTISVLPDNIIQEAIDRIYCVGMQYRTKVMLGEEVSRPSGVLIKAEPDKVLQEVSITPQAYKRARKISNLFRRSEGSLEVAMHLFTHVGEKKHVITDVLPAYNQQVTQSRCRFAPYSPLLYPEELEYVGWCHSHGDHNTFHSPIDDVNVANKLPREGKRIKGVDITYLPSLVVNARASRPHCSLGIRYFDFDKNSYCNLIREVPLVFVKSEHKPVDFDLEDFIDREVVEDVTHRRH